MLYDEFINPVIGFLDLHATRGGLVLPFLTIVLQMQGSGTCDNIAAAQDHCAGSSSASVKVGDNWTAFVARELAGKTGVIGGTFDTTAFSIATNGTGARLYMAWTADKDAYCVKHLKSFCLTAAEHLFQLQAIVEHILHWGYTERLDNLCSDSTKIIQSRLDMRDVGALV